MTLPLAADVWQFTVAELSTVALEVPAHGDTSVVYVLHFEPRLHHAQHYIGLAHDGNVTRRLNQHLRGHGSRLVRAASLAGCFVSVVLVVPGGLGLERRLHNRHGTRVCPLCTGRTRLF